MHRYRVLHSLTGHPIGAAYSQQDRMALKLSTKQLYLPATQIPVVIEVELAPAWGLPMCG